MLRECRDYLVLVMAANGRWHTFAVVAVWVPILLVFPLFFAPLIVCAMHQGCALVLSGERFSNYKVVAKVTIAGVFSLLLAHGLYMLPWFLPPWTYMWAESSCEYAPVVLAISTYSILYGLGLAIDAPAAWLTAAMAGVVPSFALLLVGMLVGDNQGLVRVALLLWVMLSLGLSVPSFCRTIRTRSKQQCLRCGYPRDSRMITCPECGFQVPVYLASSLRSRLPD